MFACSVSLFDGFSIAKPRVIQDANAPKSHYEPILVETARQVTVSALKCFTAILNSGKTMDSSKSNQLYQNK